jgi:hypothetical protein
MADTRRTPIATDALSSRKDSRTGWTAPTPDPGDRDGSKAYGTARAFPDPLAIRTPRKTVVGR